MIEIYLCLKFLPNIKHIRKIEYILFLHFQKFVQRGCSLMGFRVKTKELVTKTFKIFQSQNFFHGIPKCKMILMGKAVQSEKFFAKMFSQFFGHASFFAFTHLKLEPLLWYLSFLQIYERDKYHNRGSI